MLQFQQEIFCKTIRFFYSQDWKAYFSHAFPRVDYETQYKLLGNEEHVHSTYKLTSKDFQVPT